MNVPKSQGSSVLLKLVKLGIVLCVAVAVLVWPVAWYLGSTARTVQLISPFDEARIAAARWEYEEDPSGREADVIAIYGTAFGAPEDVVLADDARIFQPAENPALHLMPKAAGENPLKMSSVRLIARMTSIGASVGAFVLVLLLLVLRRRRAAAVSAAGALAGGRPSDAETA